MSDVHVRNLAKIKSDEQFSGRDVGEALEDLQRAVNNLGQQTNAAPVGIIPAPPPIAGLSVTGGAGIVHAQVTDGTQFFRGKEYHFEVVPAGQSFEQYAHPISSGPARAIRTNLGSGNYDVRVCTGYSTSNPSPWTYQYGVDATGATPPAFPVTTGSGTGGGGFGAVPFTGDTIPKR